MTFPVTQDLMDAILTETIGEDSVETNEPSDVELQVIEKSNYLALQRWNIVRCPKCKKTFDMLTCSYSDGSLVCPHCKSIS